jgi:hypothetical protein
MNKLIVLAALTFGVASAQATGNVNVQFADNTNTVRGYHTFVPSVSVNGQYVLPTSRPVTVAGKLGLKGNQPGTVDGYNYRLYGAVQVAARYNQATLYLGAQRDFVQNASTTFKVGVLLGTPVHFYGDN